MISNLNSPVNNFNQSNSSFGVKAPKNFKKVFPELFDYLVKNEGKLLEHVPGAEIVVTDATLVKKPKFWIFIQDKVSPFKLVKNIFTGAADGKTHLMQLVEKSSNGIDLAEQTLIKLKNFTEEGPAKGFDWSKVSKRG